ncbi:MAG: DUF1549 domain-containing protein, partial [Pirellulaceae bacterium]|nr:DUF1549 domain-containing protein [Pirellulaceae bacterium]
MHSFIRFGRVSLIAIGVIAAACVEDSLAADGAEGDKIDFNRDVRPILSNACFKCHGPDARQRQADLRLDRQADAFGKRDGRAAIAPTLLKESEAYLRITSTDADLRMPPPDSGRNLTKDQIATLSSWIEQGAPWQDHWAFAPPRRWRTPAVLNNAWPRSAIDHFVLARLEAEGLGPSPPATRRALIRRASLDLTGIPPTPAEVDAFLNDSDPHAFDRVVDRLLSSPRYGERMALEWLDAARYADTHGYHEDYHREMWPWRDWVISAFNSNMPFDQFTIEQLAGDLLPNATNDQIVATGFNRNHGVTASGISEEYRVAYVLDRVRTTATVWLGLTMHCAQCHDHKYDPISQTEFYRFFAYFNSITDKGVENRSGNVDPLVRVNSPALDARWNELKEGIAATRAALELRKSSAADALDKWERGLVKAGQGKRVDPPSGVVFHYPLDSTDGDEISNRVGERGAGKLVGETSWTEDRPGGALQLAGKGYIDLGDVAGFAREDAFSYGAWIAPQSSGAVIARMDDADSYRGWDLYLAGTQIEAHVIHRWPANAIHARTKKHLKRGEWIHAFVTYDGSSKAAGLRIYLNGEPQDLDVTQDGLSATIKTSKPLHIGRRNPSGYFTGAIDDVRIYGRQLSGGEVATLAKANPITPILAIAKEKRTKTQQAALRDYYLAEHDDQYRRLAAKLRELQAAEKENRERAGKLTVMVMQEMKAPRKTYVLNRGQYDQHGEIVRAGTPSALPPLPPQASATRLDLARWLVGADHPLTARVTVNRIWQMLFGVGIVKTSEDFGAQGEPPSHPQLLDWLATEFARDWDVRRLVKLIVSSATYQQSAKMTAAGIARDPDNRLLGRGPRFRLPAELIRDNALAIGGLLVEQVGGPSVKPYQPAGLWKE